MTDDKTKKEIQDIMDELKRELPHVHHSQASKDRCLLLFRKLDELHIDSELVLETEIEKVVDLFKTDKDIGKHAQELTEKWSAKGLFKVKKSIE